MLCNRRKNDQQDYLDQIWGRKVYLLTLKAEEFFSIIFAIVEILKYNL